MRENEAYLRITVARAARENPVLLEMLRNGRLHLSGIARLAPHLTRQNAEAVPERASGMSHREIRAGFRAGAEARCRPQRPQAASESRTGQRESAATRAPRAEPDAVKAESRVAASARPPLVEPLAPARYLVRFTASAELREKLERLQSLMRSAVADGDLAQIVDIVVTEKLERYGVDVMARFRAAASRAAVPVDAYGARIVVRSRRLSSG